MAIIDNFSKTELRQLVEESISMKELVTKLGYACRSGSNHKTVKTRLEKYEIDYSHFGGMNKVERTEENVFCKDSTASQKVLRTWYIKGNYTEYKCSICGLEPMWNGKPLTLTLDHKDGNNTNDEFENLRWVCPNCDRQLDTFAGKNLKKT